jgi:NAD(P)-dependent dehydrogenase (short-subunit alcohol dehydrogenase family)
LGTGTLTFKKNNLSEGSIDMHCDGSEPNRIERVASSIPMKCGGDPQEVAESILWLLSDKASYVTGTFIDIAGGR